MRGVVGIVGVSCAVLSAFAGAESAPPLEAPKAPTAEVRGTPGSRRLYYWAYAVDARGHSAYSPVCVVPNAPDALSEQNCVALTVEPVAGAAGYGIISSRMEPPADLKIEIKATGNKTYYYWLQARNGRSVWSPVSGPFKAERCAEVPTNALSWKASPETACCYVYRTETPEPPVGYRNYLVFAWQNASTCVDNISLPGSLIVNPKGNASEPPVGIGKYLVGESGGGAVVDTGQALRETTAYDLNTTDPANKQFMPTVKGYVVGQDRGAFQFDHDNTLASPQYGWDHFEGVSVHQVNRAGGLNEYPRDTGEVYAPMVKNTHIAYGYHQYNYASSQKAGIYGTIYNYGNGDCVGEVLAISSSGQNRAGGDEGSEFFSYHLNRALATNTASVGVDARKGDTTLIVAGQVGNICADRGIVNLSRAYQAGQARVEGRRVKEGGGWRTWDPHVVGTNTAWVPDMEGWWISFDADRRKDGIRQWYRVERVLGPTRMKLFAPTYWSGACYLGQAVESGPYLLCPYTEMKDGSVANRLRVAPLTCDWRQGDRMEIIAGPQLWCRLGFWEMGGKYLPQDCVAGLGIVYHGDKDPLSGAVAVYGGRWLAGLEAHGTKSGMWLENVDVGVALNTNCPVVLRAVGENESAVYQVTQDNEGLYVESVGPPNRRAVGLTTDGIRLYQGGLAGNDRTRGSAVFSGDGRTQEFAVTLPAVHAAKPFVVASSNQRIGMGVEKVTVDGFTAAFASPPPAGKDNVVVTWMTQD